MGFFELITLAVGLSMDAFAVSVCKGLAIGRARWRQALVAGLWFGGFQMLMPLLGFLLAHSFAQAIASFDHWIAFLLLAVIGGNMIREALSAEEEEVSGDLSARAMLLVAGVSLPLFVDGHFNFSSIWVAISLIGLTTFLFSALGVKLGNRFGARHRKKAELTGGVILILLGLKILLEHLDIL